MINQALAKEAIVVNWINSLLILVFPRDLLKIREMEDAIRCILKEQPAFSPLTTVPLSVLFDMRVFLSSKNVYITIKRFSPTSESTWKRLVMETHRTTGKKRKKGTHFNEM